MSRCELQIFDARVPEIVEEACVGWDPGTGLFYSQVLESGCDEPFVWVNSSNANDVIDSVIPYVKPFDREVLLAHLHADEKTLSERSYMIEQQDNEI